MLSYFFVSVIKHLVEEIDSCFLSFLPVFLLLFLFFDSLVFDETIKLFLVCSKFLIFTFYAGQSLFRLFSFLFFHEFLILSKLSFFEYNSLNHSSICLFLSFDLLFLLLFDFFILLMDSAMHI